MPDMQIYCDHCGCGRFMVNKIKPMDVVVESLICHACGTVTGAESVVVFTERTWLSQLTVVDHDPGDALLVG
jgi:uncharacterized Zn finger protein